MGKNKNINLNVLLSICSTDPISIYMEEKPSLKMGKQRSLNYFESILLVFAWVHMILSNLFLQYI